MAKMIKKRFLAAFLSLAMVIGLLPTMVLTARAAATSLINIKADENAGYEESCLIAPDAGTTDSAGNTYAIGNLQNWKTSYDTMASPLAAADFGGTVLTQSNKSTGTIFICKYDSYGALLWAKAIGSEKSVSYTYGDNGSDIKVDSNGNVFIVGSFMEKFDFGQDGTTEATGLTSNGNGFVAKLNSSGNLQWVIPIVSPSGGSSADALALDGSGNAYVTGSYYGSATAKGTDNAEVTFASGTGKNIYVMELSGAGIIGWVQTAQSGGTGDPTAYDITVSSDGSAVYAVGQSYGLTVNGTPYAGTGNTDGYIMKTNGSGILQWFGTTKGTSYDCINGVRLDASGNPVIMGWYSGDSLDIDPSVAEVAPYSSLGTLGSFVAELSPTDGSITWYTAADSHSYFDSLYVDSNAIYIGGYSDDSTAYYTLAGSATGSIGTLGTASHLLIKLTTAGAFSLAKTLGNEKPSYEYDKLTDISAADGGGLRIIASVAAPFDIDPGVGTTYAHGTSDANRNNAMAIFTVTSDCESSTFAEDTAAPTAATTAASNVSSTAATLNGTVNANGDSTTVTFEYGTTTGYGTSVTATPSPVTGTSATSVSYALSGLSPNTTYHYRVKAVNAGGTTTGSDMTFSTDVTAPTVVFTSLDSTGKIVTLTFSEALDYSTVISGNFTGTAGAPTVSYSEGATTLTLTYGTAISAGSGSTIIVGTGVTDVAGNAIAETTFTEGSTSGFTGVDTTAPTVTKLGDGTKDYTIVPRAIVTLTFSEAINPANMTAVQTALSAGCNQLLAFSWDSAELPTVLEIFNASFSDTAIFANDVTASVSDISGNSANLTLVDSSADETAPSVTKLGDGTKDYSIAASGTATLTFSEALSSASQVAVETALSAGSSLTLNYSWSGVVLTITNTSATSYAVFANDVTASVSDVAENSATLTLVDSSADETAPTVSFMSINSAGKIVTLAFSEALDYSTAIADNFTGTAGTPTVSYSEGATTLTLTYGTAISAGSGSTIVVGTGVTDVAENAIAETTFTEGSTSGFDGLDTTAPTISSVAAPANGTYIAGQNFNFIATFSEAVTITGSPSIELAIGSSTVNAVYASGSGSSSLTFQYTIVSGNADADGIVCASPITLPTGATIKDAAGNDAILSFTSPTTTAVLVDGVIPAVSSMTGPSAETYIIGDDLDFTATFSEAVTITGSPSIELTIGSSTVSAVYGSGSGTTALTFRYTIVSGNADADGIACAAKITLPTGATIKDAAGNDATLSITPPTTSAVLVDGVIPAVSSMTGPSAETYIIGDDLDFTATFSEAVTVTGSPSIELAIGSSTVNAVYASGSGTTALTFRYTIVSGNADADGIACAAKITLPTGATIKDAAGNDATLSFTPPTTTAVLVDGVAPMISSAVIASGNSYIDITFSKGVYGASDGTTALTAAKLALTFTKNSGSATNVMISSIKKDDNASETSAAALTGGETTVRVFLSITGSPSGTETIEIKPANAFSVFDFNGNVMASTQTTGAKALLTSVSYGGDSSSTGAGAAVIVNGESQTAGTSQTTTSASGQTVTTVTVDSNKLENILASEKSGAMVTIPITGSDVAAGTLTGAMVKSMENKDATLAIQTDSGTYTLPAFEINIDAVSKQLGTNVSLSDIDVTINISEPSTSMMRVVEDAAQDGGFTIMVPAVDYTITCTHGSQAVNVSSFNAYVERTIAIPDGVDPMKITTGVVVDASGTTHHVPTKVTVINGKYYAVINSLTNSTYSVIWNPIEFSDVSNHWAKDAINNMGSRMVVTGVGSNKYAPNRNMTRAEFATIMVRALGLEPGTGVSGFGDVNAADWYCGYIKTAAAYGIIKGYDNGNFGPNDTITREQAMTMIARAMKVTGLDTGLDAGEVGRLLSTFTDGTSASVYAKESIAACLKTGIVSGTSDTTISPKDDITRAEVAVMVQRLLQKSNLI